MHFGTNGLVWRNPSSPLLQTTTLLAHSHRMQRYWSIPITGGSEWVTGAVFLPCLLVCLLGIALSSLLIYHHIGKVSPGFDTFIAVITKWKSLAVLGLYSYYRAFSQLTGSGNSEIRGFLSDCSKRLWGLMNSWSDRCRINEWLSWSIVKIDDQLIWSIVTTDEWPIWSTVSGFMIDWSDRLKWTLLILTDHIRAAAVLCGGGQMDKTVLYVDCVNVLVGKTRHFLWWGMCFGRIPLTSFSAPGWIETNVAHRSTWPGGGDCMILITDCYTANTSSTVVAISVFSFIWPPHRSFDG